MVVLRDTISGRYAIEDKGKWYDKVLDNLWHMGPIGRFLYVLTFEVLVAVHRFFGAVKNEELNIKI